MTDQEMQIAIAEECGWEFHPECGPLDFPWWHRTTKQRASNESLPAYTKDANAVAEARRALSLDEQEQFAYELLAVLKVNCDEPCTPIELFSAIDASARQQAQAVLRVKGKWKD